MTETVKPTPQPGQCGTCGHPSFHYKDCYGDPVLALAFFGERLRRIKETIGNAPGNAIVWANRSPELNALIAGIRVLKDSQAQIAAQAETIKRLTASLAAYAERCHTKGCSHGEIAVANCCEGNDVFLNMDTEKARADALQAFKDFVHRRLDTAGVPKNPEPPKHALEGCRIGDRLDWIVTRADAAEARLTFEEIRDAIVGACEPCGGKGGISTTTYGHACGGDDRRCATECPVPEEDFEQCEYCGRPVSAVEQAILAKARALLSGSATSEPATKKEKKA